MTAKTIQLRQRHPHVLETRERESLPLPVTGVILCGGQSKRMGTDKALLPFRGQTFLEHRVTNLRSLLDEVIVVANQPERYSHICTNLVQDVVPDRGPLVGILSGLLSAGNDYCLIIACDMPLVSNHLVRGLAQSRWDADIMVLEHKLRVEPLLGIYSKNCIQALENAVFQGRFKVTDFISELKEQSRVRTYQFEPGSGQQLPPFFNVNTPAEYSSILLYS